jgi:benzoylformate decarboxylase
VCRSDAARVSKSAELAPALKRGLAHDGVSLIEVIVDSAVPLLYARKG